MENQTRVQFILLSFDTRSGFKIPEYLFENPFTAMNKSSDMAMTPPNKVLYGKLNRNVST